MATLLNAVTTGTGTMMSDGVQRDLVFYVEPAGTIAAGTVQIEEARTINYAGTWSPIGAAIVLATGVLSVVRVTGSFLAVRARLTADVAGGGTVTVEVSGV